jgi:CRP/FNR family transcriptional regulator/CRP/FNR family cyclic AMP-dependent transcriptional regulator
MNKEKETHINTYLKGVPLFSNLNDEQIKLLSGTGTVTSFLKDNVIVHQNQPGETFYIVISGRVKITLLNKDGREIVLSILKKGEFFGELALLDNERRSANVIAMDDASLFLITRTQFYQLIETYPPEENTEGNLHPLATC